MPRTKGAIGKRSAALAQKLREDYDLDAVCEMAEHAVWLSTRAKKAQQVLDAIEEGGTPEGEVLAFSDVIEATKEAINACEKIAQYTTPKLKTIEHVPGVGEDEDGNERHWIIEVVGASKADNS